MGCVDRIGRDVGGMWVGRRIGSTMQAEEGSERGWTMEQRFSHSSWR